MPAPIPGNENAAILKLRLPHELKRRLKNAALNRRKADLSELVREILWDAVEKDDPSGRQAAQQQLQLLSGGEK